MKLSLFIHNSCHKISQNLKSHSTFLIKVKKCRIRFGYDYELKLFLSYKVTNKKMVTS